MTKLPRPIKAWAIVLAEKPVLLDQYYPQKKYALKELQTFGRPKSEYKVIPVLITPIIKHKTK